MKGIQLTDLPCRARLFVKRTPWLYIAAKRLTGRGAEDHLCRPNSDLCIEGYPSSGNSFSYAILKFANQRLRIAHHCHSVANLRLALDYRVPAVSLIRDPADAIASRLVRFDGSPRAAILEYLDFYEFVLAHIDRMTVVTFQEVTQHPADFLDRVARATGLPIAISDIESLELSAIAYLKEWTSRNADIEKISLPANAREISKAQLRDAIRDAPRFDEARMLWHRITQLSDRAVVVP